MDYLTLGDGKKGHCRLLLKIGMGTFSASITQDFPKQDCDFSHMISGSNFGPKVGAENRIPVFWMIGNTNSVTSGNTPEEVVRKNPKGDLAIVYIRLSK